MALLEIDDVKVHFPVGGGILRKPLGVVRAVDGVSLALNAGEVLALVGESGCGKSTLARAVLGLLPATNGAVRFEGRTVTGLSGNALRRYRRNVQMVFQDPFDSLNPRKSILQTLARPLSSYDVVPRSEIRREAARLLEMVGLTPAQAILERYPHQFSGGQRQRICIARAIAVRPKVIVADEAVSALDISIRAQILTLMRDLQRELDLAYIFVSHDLGVVRSMSDRVAVMYLGRLVETGSTDEVCDEPKHPYTRALLAASPIPDPALARQRQYTPLKGDVPSPMEPPVGCHFHPRCSIAEDICCRDTPVLRRAGASHWIACHFGTRQVETVSA